MLHKLKAGLAVYMTLNTLVKAQSTAFPEFAAACGPELTWVTEPSPAPTPPPLTTLRLLPLGENVSGIPQSAIDCWESHANYTASAAWLTSAAARVAEWTEGPRIPPLESTYTSTFSDKCSSTAIGLTTLCDGWPRASHLQEDCITSTSSSVSTYSTTDCINYPTWTSEYTLPASPTCTIATDYSPMCTRLAEVYDSLTDRYLASSTKPEETNIIDSALRAEAPPCAVLHDALTTGATPTCQIISWSYEAYYWPTPTPTNTSICGNGTNGTLTTSAPTPTLPGTLELTKSSCPTPQNSLTRCCCCRARGLL